MDANKQWAMIQSMMVGDFNPNHDPKNGQFTTGSGGASVKSTESKRLPRSRGHQIITPSDDFTPGQHSRLQDLEGQAYEFLELHSKDNDEDFMDLWGVSEPYEEDGITYVDAEYNVVTKSGRRVDRASKVPVSLKENKTKAAKKSETSTGGKIVDVGGGQWYGENDNGSSVSILDGGKEDYNLWKYGSKQVYEVQPVSKDLKWGEKEYYSKKSEAVAAAKAHLKKMAQDTLASDFNPNHDPEDGRFTSGSLLPTDHSKSFFSERRANEFAKSLTGAKNIQVSGRRDAFGQSEYIVAWDNPDETSTKLKNSPYFKRATGMSGLKPVLASMDKGSQDAVVTAVSRAVASPGGKDATIRFGNKSIKVTAPSKDKRAVKQYGIEWTGAKQTPTASYHGEASDLATHLLITLKDMGYSGEKITLDQAVGDEDGAWKTINGTHVFIEGGEITKGPSALTGRKSTGSKSAGGSSASEKPAETKSKSQSVAEAFKSKVDKADSLDKLRTEMRQSAEEEIKIRTSSNLSNSEYKKQMKAHLERFNDLKKRIEAAGGDPSKIYNETKPKNWADVIESGGKVKPDWGDGEKKSKTSAKASAKTTEKSVSSPKKTEAINRAIKKDLDLDDLEYKNRDSYDFFDNARGSISVGDLETMLNKCYDEGVKKASGKGTSISAAQIERAAAKIAKEHLGYDLNTRGRDAYDYFDNDRGGFSIHTLKMALEHAYGAGYSSGDNYRNTRDSASEWNLVQDMLIGDFNPNHDPENGQFTSGSGGSAPRGSDLSHNVAAYEKDPLLPYKEHWSDAYFNEVREALEEKRKEASETPYYGKTGKVKYRDLEFEIDNNGHVTSGPKELLAGLKNPKAPGEDLKQGDIVQYAPKWRSPGEEKYIHVILEERGKRCLIGTLNTRLTLGSTQEVDREMIQSLGYNAGVSDDWKKFNDPD